MYAQCRIARERFPLSAAAARPCSSLTHICGRTPCDHVFVAPIDVLLCCSVFPGTAHAPTVCSTALEYVSLSRGPTADHSVSLFHRSRVQRATPYPSINRVYSPAFVCCVRMLANHGSSYDTQLMLRL